MPSTKFLTSHVVQTSSRPRGDTGGLSNRRGHTSQLSISDESHHITETIGTLYGDEEEPSAESSRPLSFVGGPSRQEQVQYRQSSQLGQNFRTPRRPLHRSQSDQTPYSGSLSGEHVDRKHAQTLLIRSSTQVASISENGTMSPSSPVLSLRDIQSEASSSQLPLTNIENPNDIAQELSNLQKLRRLSMDVGNTIDPDMPHMSLSAMPSMPPRGSDDENDPSRLLWVPASVHPELAPTEFKNFLEHRVQSIRRRSGESLNYADGGLNRNPSNSSLGGSGSLRRRSSKLSRQIDVSSSQAAGYVDGAEHLQRQRSRDGSRTQALSIDELVKDPTKAVQKLAHGADEQGQANDGNTEDMPILPMVPGMGLRRSTRTTYRKGGSLRSSDGSSSRRVKQRRQDDDTASETPVSLSVDAPKGYGLSRVQSEPVSDNFAMPSRPVREHRTASPDLAIESTHEPAAKEVDESWTRKSKITSQGDLSVSAPAASSRHYEPAPGEAEAPTDNLRKGQEGQYSRSFPERSSSQKNLPQPEPEAEPESAIREPPARSSRRPAASLATHSTHHSVSKASQQYSSISSSSKPIRPAHSLNETLNSSPSPLLGDGTRTDSLTFIPTLSQEEERRLDKKSKKDRDEDSLSTSTSRTGSAWKWFKGSADDKDKKKDESKRARMKAAVDRAQDNARLDVLQTSIEKSPRGRESLVLDRDNMDNKLQEERKKESSRKSDSKKEKDGSIFSSFFGGSKRKEEKERGNKKSQHLQVPEEPLYKPLQPDVDYNWTRFPLLEERAIYRMAHIKLANPRRPLLSQVLLSNFMYSYLAIVQAMHPQMNVPLSPQQKRLEEEARRKQQHEYMAQQELHEDDDDPSNYDQYNFDYHRAAVQYAESGDQVDYVDDAQIYEDEHGDESADSYDYGNASGVYDPSLKEYYQYHDEGSDHRDDRRSDTW